MRAQHSRCFKFYVLRFTFYASHMYITILSALFVLASSVGANAAKSYTFGMIGKSQGNPFFEAAHAGANDAARELGAKYGIRIKIDWRTPNEEDAQKQAQLIEQLTLAGTDGIIISCSDATKVTDAINKAVRAGIPVVTFSGDAPASETFDALGVEAFKCG